jgi:alpha-tubulin suppressor-like RCC1 family protein
MPNKKFCRIESEWGFFRHFALALDVNGGLWVWGDNYYGQLGQGGESSGATDPWTDSGNDTPVRIKKDVRFVEIATNGEACGAIDEEGKLWLWGDNENGELANGKVYDGNDLSTSMSWLSSSTPAVAIETEEIRFSKVYCMKQNTFVIDYEGNIWGCGNDYFERLGNAKNADSSVLIQITSEVRFKEIGYFSPSVALDEYGGLWWWGYDRYELCHVAECLKLHIHDESCEGVIACTPIEIEVYDFPIITSFAKSTCAMYVLSDKSEVFSWTRKIKLSVEWVIFYLGDGTSGWDSGKTFHNPVKIIDKGGVVKYEKTFFGG